MTNIRKSPSPNQNSVLLAQVDQLCPLCNDTLMYSKHGILYRNYDVAHIYPLNPKRSEAVLLDGVNRLSSDPNHIDNLIPLCKNCHGKFDKPRTIDEYNILYDVKKVCIEKHAARSIIRDHQVSSALRALLASTLSANAAPESSELTYRAMSVDSKVGESMNPIDINSIKHNVIDYFGHIQDLMALAEAESPGSTDIMSLEIKHFYSIMCQTSDDHKVIYDHIVDWLSRQIQPHEETAADIIASFFVQNCEIF